MVRSLVYKKLFQPFIHIGCHTVIYVKNCLYSYYEIFEIENRQIENTLTWCYQTSLEPILTVISPRLWSLQHLDRDITEDCNRFFFCSLHKTFWKESLICDAHLYSNALFKLPRKYYFAIPCFFPISLLSRNFRDPLPVHHSASIVYLVGK